MSLHYSKWIPSLLDKALEINGMPVPHFSQNLGSRAAVNLHFYPPNIVVSPNNHAQTCSINVASRKAVSHYTLSVITLFPETPNPAQNPSYLLWSEMLQHNPLPASLPITCTHKYTYANMHTKYAIFSLSEDANHTIIKETDLAQ